MTDRGDATGLNGLPLEILLDIAKYLESARDLRALSQTSKKLHQCINSSSAWQEFAQSKFPLLSIPLKTGRRYWKGVAESLTYQTRCWDRRSIRFTAMYPRQQTHRRGLAFQPVVDVDYNMNSGREMVVWGAGEDIVARYRGRARTRGLSGTTSWYQLEGADQGLRPGYDDVTALATVRLPHLGAPAILAGRDNGDLSLLSGEANNSFGRRLASFSPEHASGSTEGIPTAERPAQNTIMSLDTLNENNEGLVAACSNLGVSLYRLPEDNSTTNIAPVEIYDLAPHTTRQVWNAKWMGGSDLLAIALQGTHEPLRYLTVTPSGWTVEAAAKNARVEQQFGKREEQPVFANSLQPVRRVPGATATTPLLLSSWKDGTIR